MLLNQETADRLIGTLPGDIGFYAEDTATGEAVSHCPEIKVEAASVIKLLVMAEAYRQRETGELDFGRMITVRPEDCVPSCGAITYLHRGISLPVEDLVTLMIILSDNTATNLLIDLLGKERIMAFGEQLGLEGFVLRRKMFESELARLGIINEVSAAGCARFMRLLLQEKLVSPQASREMLQHLKDQRLDGKMPFYLHSRHIPTAHKTGEDGGITHDVGIIFADTPRIFCFVSQHTDVPKAELVMQKLAALCADVDPEEACL